MNTEYQQTEIEINTFKYQDRIDKLKKKKLEQTDEKILVEGLLDEDDYGRVVPPKDHWEIIPNHEDGSFYGFEAWTDNFCSLMENHPVYIDPNDAFAGRWMYFMSKMRPNKWNPKYPFDHLKENIEKYNIIHGIGDDAHFSPDYKIGLDLGWGGLLEKLYHYKEINGKDKHEFYDFHIRAIKAVQVWIKNHINKIYKLAEIEKDPALKQNLYQMADVNQKILNNAPSSLREALQWIIWFHLASRTYNRDGAGGQIDELLRPYYEKDIEAGIITEDETVYYLASFLINDPIYWQLGGPDENGSDVTSEISFLILKAADKINTSLNITVRVHDGLNKDLFNESLHYLVKNKNAWPRFSGDKALVEGFMRNGFSESLAKKRIAVGCNWMSLPGLEYTMNDLVKVNMAKVFEVAYEEMLNDQRINNSTEFLWKLFDKHLKIAVATAAEGIKFHLKYQKYNEPELMLNLLSHGPIEKGHDVSDGGATYYNLAIDGAGLATVADSFSALEQRIEKEEKLSWAELDDHIKNNFDDVQGERIRLLLKNSDRYAQGNSIGDKWALKIKERFIEYVREHSEKEKRYLFIPGFFSWANTLGFGQAVKATPNGRKDFDPISHGANPHPGFSMDGASLAMANAIAQIQPGFGNTAPMQWELDPTMATKDYISLIGTIIKTHFELGGTLINVNIMDKQKVLEAHKDPSKYPDLVVRVTGFTAYFSMLSPKFRQLVVDRILEN